MRKTKWLDRNVWYVGPNFKIAGPTSHSGGAAAGGAALPASGESPNQNLAT